MGGWEALHNPSVPGGQVNYLVRAPSNPDVLYADLMFPYSGSEDQILYRSLDGGQTWQDTHNNRLAVSSHAVDTQDPKILYGTLFAPEYNQLIRSLDGGDTWESWPGSFSNFGPESKLEVDNFGGVYLFTTYAIYHRGVSDGDWTRLSAPFPTNLTTGAFWRGNSPFLISTGWGGMYRLYLPPIHRQWLPVLEK